MKRRAKVTALKPNTCLGCHLHAAIRVYERAGHKCEPVIKLGPVKWQQFVDDCIEKTGLDPRTEECAAFGCLVVPGENPGITVEEFECVKETSL